MSRAPLVVLHSLRPPRSTSGYVDMVVGATAPGTTLRFFSWPMALAGRYDVLHVHWPELLVRDSARPWRRVVKRRLLDLLLLRLRLTRTPLVWTAHNPAPHESGPPAEQRSLARLARRVDLVVDLGGGRGTATGATRAETVAIPLGHYRDLYARHPAPVSEDGRLLHFGIVRPYKGVPDLLEAFSGLSDPGARLSVVGNPHPGQGEAVERAAAADARISATLAYVEDDVLVEEIRRAQLVVLPYLGGMRNSGAILAALSLDRPVLVPRSPTNAALDHEVGPGWVLQYDGGLTSADLSEALVATAHRPGEPPRLDARGVPAQRAAYREAYDRAQQIARSPRRLPPRATGAGAEG